MAVEADSYCLQIDVEGRTGRGVYSGSTFPSAVQVLVFMEDRAAEVTGVLTRAGLVASPASGSDPLPASNTQEVALKNLAAMANALLAAGDAEHSREQRAAGDEGSKTAASYWEEGQRLMEQLFESAVILGTASSGPDRGHIKSGGIAKAVFNEAPNAGEDRPRSDAFSLDNKW